MKVRYSELETEKNTFSTSEKMFGLPQGKILTELNFTSFIEFYSFQVKGDSVSLMFHSFF